MTPASPFSGPLLPSADAQPGLGSCRNISHLNKILKALEQDHPGATKTQAWGGGKQGTGSRTGEVTRLQRDSPVPTMNEYKSVV